MLDVVCNTSPLQYLHQVALLELLPDVFGKVHVPIAVASELAQGRRLGISLPDVNTLSWVEIQQVSDSSALADNLGRGEAEVIALGLRLQNALVVLDDREARRQAAAMGLEMVGTLGILVLAKEKGLLGAVAPPMEKLQAAGFRLSESVRHAALMEAGEVV